MIEITDKRNCTGCGACVNACPKKIIKFEEDIEGFFYPSVDVERCINCHLCEKACPLLHYGNDCNLSDKSFPTFYAAQLKNSNDLKEVSSGGAFWALAQSVLLEGGCVYGAVQEGLDSIIHIRADSIDEVRKMRRSKYFQSDTSNTLSTTKSDLLSGKIVLYS